MNLNPGQIPALVIALLGAVLDAVTIFAPTALTPAEKTAILTVATAAVPVGLAIYAYISHSVAQAAKKP